MQLHTRRQLQFQISDILNLNTEHNRTAVTLMSEL